MKIFILLMLFFTSITANAEWIARTKNSGGGDIVLLTQQCSAPNSNNWYAMYSSNSDGLILPGCWMLTSTDIVVVFNNGIVKVYDGKGWTVNKDFVK